MTKEKEEKKKKAKTRSKKRLILEIIITIILGIAAYLLGTVIAKNVMESKQPEENKTDIDFNFTNIETIDSIDIDTLIQNYNQLLNENNLSSYQISIDELTANDYGMELTKEDLKYSFQLENDQVNITMLDYKEKNDLTEQLSKLLIKANNPDLDDESINLLYEKTFETEDTTQEETYGLSEYFQYGGLEVSLKTYLNQEYLYQIRIGRLTTINE